MKDLTFTDINNTVNVTYRTDLIGSNSGNFTVMQITGLTDLDASKVGMNFQKLSYNLTDFIEFAKAHALKLVSSDSSGNTTLVDSTSLTSSLGWGVLGQDGI